ncbi:MAG: hypothetical protein LPK26_17375 [Bacillaceae bacterium]|nr:hypothetical protein [Bacillaceae bacterium]
MSITDEILTEFKERMHLEDHEDENLRRILSASLKALKRLIPGAEINEDEEFKELVFERSRYVYNDALEYFNKNFLNNITSLQIDKALEGDSDESI